MIDSKWEYKIVDYSNSTSMGYSNPETEEFKEKHKDKDWKIESVKKTLMKRKRRENNSYRFC